jgi:hypothetical protein
VKGGYAKGHWSLACLILYDIYCLMYYMAPMPGLANAFGPGQNLQFPYLFSRPAFASPQIVVTAASLDVARSAGSIRRTNRALIFV